MTHHVLAIDQGTTGSTCLVIAAEGAVVGRGYREITQYFPRPGWVEHDATEILDRTVDAAREAIAQSGVTPDAIGITNQRETVVVWDRATGTPVARAIVWQDRRTAARCEELAPRAAWFADRTGLVVDPYFSATKLEWLLASDEGLAARAAAGELAAGTIDSWLVWKLTRGVVHATEPTNASRTLLFDIRTLGWSDELCDVFRVPRAMLPEVRPSAGDFGTAVPEFFGAAMPIAGIAGDQQAALFGQGCWSAGEGKNTYGTGAFLLLNTGAVRPAAGDGVLTTVACDAGGAPAYAMEGAIFIAGAAIQWLRDGLGILQSASESEEMARSLHSNEGVYFVPALVGLGAPHWEPAARGTIVGLTRGSTRAHLVRAAVEAMAYSTADIAALMQRKAGVAFERLRVDGGASLNDWLMQYQADVLGIPVERPDMVETTALGAAGLAGLAAGIWPDAGRFLATRTFKRFEAGTGRPAARKAAEGWARAVRATLAWARDSA
ncbi:MAG TPA: glycerol kinase GlpK [Gemmatimonadaceae bacterium]|nr:glycerol kinase GlpK [Gemmatimonadaceae bacterium]